MIAPAIAIRFLRLFGRVPLQWKDMLLGGQIDALEHECLDAPDPLPDTAVKKWVADIKKQRGEVHGLKHRQQRVAFVYAMRLAVRLAREHTLRHVQQ